MEIAIFADCYLPIKSGVVTSVLQLKEGLAKKGHHVVVVTVQVNGYEEKDPHILLLPSFSIGLGTEQVCGLVNQRKVNDFIKNHNIKLVHTHSEFSLGFSGKRVAKKFNIPHVHTTHTMWEEYRHYILKGKLLSPQVIRKILTFFLKNTYALVAPSAKAEKYFKSLIPSIPIQIIPNGIDINKFKITQFTQKDIIEKRKSLNIRETDTVIIFVGRIGQEKRVIELFNAVLPILKNNSDVKMMFVGDGPLLIELKFKANKSTVSNQFIFTGFVNWNTVHELYSISNLFVTASLSEVHPMTLIEALMCSLPIIARKDETYSDLVWDEVNGILVDMDEQLTIKITEMISDKNKLKKFAKESLNISQSFTADKHINHIESFYEKVLASYPATLTVGR